MHEPDCGSVWINDVNCAAIGHVNANRGLPLVGDEAIISSEVLVVCHLAIDHGHPIAVHLMRGQQRPCCHPQTIAGRSMRRIEPPQHFSFAVSHFDAGHPFYKRASAYADRIKGPKMLDRGCLLGHRTSYTEASVNSKPNFRSVDRNESPSCRPTAIFSNWSATSRSEFERNGSWW